MYEIKTYYVRSYLCYLPSVVLISSTVVVCVFEITFQYYCDMVSLHYLFHIFDYSTSIS